ncbi:MAG: hypothetical protein SWQ30_15635 [Thermodesulfobacteriota bacterium]|nr:hypothetical protein [Thermodesulfobacteriota bacterium]
MTSPLMGVLATIQVCCNAASSHGNVSLRITIRSKDSQEAYCFHWQGMNGLFYARRTIHEKGRHR